MQRTDAFPIIRLGGLTVTVGTSALVGSLVLWLLLGLVGVFLLSFSLLKALVLGLAAVALHWVAVFLHQAGHATAARSTGYPMTGIRLWGVLSSSLYPPDEPELPVSVHIRRAMGGPALSLVVTLLALVPLFFLRAGTWAWWLALFFFLDNLLVFTLGSFLPLGFTDGSTLLSFRRIRK
jgi:hypothetical protein